MDDKIVKEILLGNKYYSEKDLRYNANAGHLLSKDELKEFKEIKERFICESHEFMVNIPLKTFNSKHFFYVNGNYLSTVLTEYLVGWVKDYELNKEFFVERHLSQIIMSRIFSEIEGTLNIENVPTTHKRVKEVCEKEQLTDKNDIIIRNMKTAMEFIIEEKPKFNKENLFRLYNILSKDCLDEEDKLNGGYYRGDSVTVGGYDGAPHEKIEELMDSLFDFVNDKESAEKFQYYLPHICHYYIVYVHPYFDYNGRTARMVSFWISYITDFYSSPLFLSEAINENKKEYYEALSNTRDMSNDLTYFLGYIYETATKFGLVYKNVEEIEKQLCRSGDFLTASEESYLKKILAHSPEAYFNNAMFIKFINNNISKQAALKILNQLSDYGILQSNTNKKGEKIFCVNQEFVTYKLN